MAGYFRLSPAVSRVSSTSDTRLASSAPPERDVDLDNVMAQILTWLDVAIVFGPQVPLLVPLVLMAVAGQRLSVRVGLARLGKREVGWSKSRPTVWSVVLSLFAQQVLNAWLYGEIGVGSGGGTKAWAWVGAGGHS